jgi:penicillin V acylase-like amidase (Ntn superfamily)
MGFVRNLAAIAAAFAAVSYTPAVVEGCTEFMLWDSIPDQIVTVRTVDFNADLLAKIVKVCDGLAC